MNKIISLYINGSDESTELYGTKYIPTTLIFGMKRTTHINRDGSTITSLANILNHITVSDENLEKDCLNGCAIDNPYWCDLNIINAWNLEKQIDEKAAEIRKEAEHNKVTLNLFGFSRGGAGAFLLASKLKDIPIEKLEINILAFDPVPGNFVNTVFLDKILGLNSTLAAQIANLSDCKNIRRVYSLYNCVTFSSVLPFAPILPVLPASCEHKVDIVPGRHHESELFRIIKDGNHVKAHNIETVIVFHQAIKFLQECGTKFDFNKCNFEDRLAQNADQKLIYADMLNKLANSDTKDQLEANNRIMHFSNTIYYEPQNSKKYLNLYHQEIEGVPENYEECILSIKDSNPQPLITNWQTSIYEYISTAIAAPLAIPQP